MQKLPWQIYGAFITTIVFGSARDIIIKDSPIRTYYTILIALDMDYILLSILNLLNLLINLLVPLVVFLYAFNIKSSLKFWRILFFLRIFFDLTGHNYTTQFIKSAFYQSSSYGFASIGFFVIPFIPSYIAHFLYAFKKPDLKTI